MKKETTMGIKRLLLAIVALAVCFTAEAQQTTGEKIKSFANEHLSLSGYLQGGILWEENADPETTFYLHRARLSLTGNALEEKIDYRLQVDMANSPKICDLYFRYKPFNWLNLQLGQFKLPFSYENENCGPTTVEFIDYSYITSFFTRNKGTYDGIDGATGRDIGFQIYGGFIEREGYSIINYNLGVFNGSGINKRDHNSSKDLIARLIIKPFKGFGITGSYMYAETNYDGNKFMKSPRWAAGLLYDSKHWVARAEYADARFGNVDANSLYVIGGYKFEKPWAIYARYEFMNTSTNYVSNPGNILYDPSVSTTLKTTDERIMVGGAYKPFKFLRLQFNLSYLMNSSSLSFASYYNNEFNNTCRLGANLLVTAMF